MTKVLFLSKGAKASSTRYRALQYFDLLKQSGFNPTHHTVSGGVFAFIQALWLASSADIIVLVRKTFPFPQLWLLRKCSKRLVFDFDDAIFCNTNGSSSKTRMKRFIQTVKICDHVFAGNQYLATTAQKYQINTTIIPTSLDTAKYDLVTERTHDHFVLVWIGSRSTKKYIASILPAIEAAASNVPNLSLRIVADFSLNSDLVKIENIPWSEEDEAAAVASADIGLAPLPPDDWTKGKCALKVLQYMAAGLPVITSPTSANAEAIDNQLNGYYAESLKDWTTTIQQAFAEQATLTEKGTNAKQKVRSRYDINVIYQKIQKILSQQSAR